MFHSTRNKIWNGNHILLRQRVWQFKIVGEEVGNIGADIQGVADSLFLLRCGVHAEFCLVHSGQLFLNIKTIKNIFYLGYIYDMNLLLKREKNIKR